MSPEKQNPHNLYNIIATVFVIHLNGSIYTINIHKWEIRVLQFHYHWCSFLRVLHKNYKNIANRLSGRIPIMQLTKENYHMNYKNHTIHIMHNQFYTAWY